MGRFHRPQCGWVRRRRSSVTIERPAGRSTRTTAAVRGEDAAIPALAVRLPRATWLRARYWWKRQCWRTTALEEVLTPSTTPGCRTSPGCGLSPSRSGDTAPRPLPGCMGRATSCRVRTGHLGLPPTWYCASVLSRSGLGELPATMTALINTATIPEYAQSCPARKGPWRLG